MTRPANSPAFATAATFPAGANPWSSQPPRVAPSGAMQTQGFTPQADLPAEYINYLIGNHGDWLAYHDSIMGFGLYGDGRDGAAVLDGVNTFPWASFGGGVYTLTRDVSLTDLAVATGIKLALSLGNSSTFRLNGTGTCVVAGTGTITAEGNPGTPTGVGGVAPAAGTVAAAGAGGTGATGAGGAGTARTASLAGSGGAGGTGSGGGAGAGGTATAPAAGLGSSAASFAQWMGHILGIAAGVSTPTALTGGGGGGAGGGNGAQVGGGGGAGAGVAAISFRSIRLATAAAIRCAGQVGGIPAGNNCGGGGGGGGGYARIVCENLTVDDNSAMSSATNCPGGAGAAGTGTGTAGAAGATGKLELVLLSQALPTTVAPSNNRQTGVAVFATGGSGNGFDYVDIVLGSPFTGAVTGAAAYKIFLGSTYVYAGLGVPEVSLVNKTLTGFRLQPDVQFAGEIYWEVEA
jgi:hypothetical protein